MRVITGTARGRKLKNFTGMETRPTTDMVKESIFSIIQFDIEGRRILDLFGGTGQLGIETLSRGAAHCTFVDSRKEAVALIRDNLASTQLEKNALVLQRDALSYLSSCGEKFDIIFLDPPYGLGILDEVVEKITAFDIVTEHGIIVCESGVETTLSPVQMPYRVRKEYRYGKTRVTLVDRTIPE